MRATHAVSARSYDYEYTAGERERENGPGGSVGERIGLSNQRDGSRGLPTAAHWPGSRARYRIIAERLAVTIHRRPTDLSRVFSDLLRAAHLQSIARDYPSLDRAARGDEAARESAYARASGCLLMRNAWRPLRMKIGMVRGVIGNHGNFTESP